ncbi:hypothetical protein DPMN_013678 [Dreissena polymorpha]|uniref:Uncharacterized protein n=1 Tax=Dreissena polymorpha TaxID=45954 RepID=A0A9D4S214_DREPO|nr:hypothetical protein DPMN_013678 [Dreissena polymorpha]
MSGLGRRECITSKPQMRPAEQSVKTSCRTRIKDRIRSDCELMQNKLSTTIMLQC